MTICGPKRVKMPFLCEIRVKKCSFSAYLKYPKSRLVAISNEPRNAVSDHHETRPKAF